MGPLVNTDWLANEIDKADLVVFDATMYLPNENKNGHAEFRRAHIPGARYFDIDLIADPDTDLPHMVPAPGRFAKLMGELGVSNASRVVFYDQKGLASAARGWWLMGLFGHDNAAVLDGGVPKWQREGRPTEAGDPASPRPAVVSSRLPTGKAARHRRRPAQRGVQGRAGAGRARGGPLHRRGPGTARRHAQRPHPRLGEPALHRSAERRRHVPLRRRSARAAGAGRRRWHAAGGDKLRLRRDGVHPDLGHAHRRACRKARCTTDRGPNGAAAPTRRWRRSDA